MMSGRFRFALTGMALTLSIQPIVAQSEWGAGAVFYIRKVQSGSPELTDTVIRDGDYVNLRGTAGDPWWIIAGGAIAGGSPTAAELLVIRKVATGSDRILRSGEYIRIRGTKGDPWLRISGDRLLADASPAEASTFVISRLSPGNTAKSGDAIRDGDYLFIRGTQGDPWLHFSGMQLLVGAPQVHAGGVSSPDSAELGWFVITPCSRLNPLPQFGEQRIHVYADAPKISSFADEVSACTDVALAACVGGSIARSGTACLPAAQSAFVGCLTTKGQELAQKAAQVKLRFETECVWP